LKPFFQNIPPSEREDVITQFCLKYPTWFFEWLTSIEGNPFVLENFQIAYLLDDTSFKIVNKTRQAGGSLIVAAAKFWKAYRNEYYRCDVVSINLKEARGKIKYVHDLWESLPKQWRHPLATDNTYSIGFHYGAKRSEINSLAASAGVRGGKKDVFFDEAAHIEKFNDLYVAALPATIRGRGSFDVVSTPLGMQGKFWEIFTNQPDNRGKPKYPGWSRHEFFWFDVTQFCTDIIGARNAWENEYEQNYAAMPILFDRFANDRMREIRGELTNEEFDQEFGCKFVDESMAFFPWELILRCAKPDEPQKQDDKDYVEKWFVRPDSAGNSEVYIGIDFAEGRKGGDETSIQIVERTPNGDLRHRAWFDLSYEGGFSNFNEQLKFINEEVIAKFKPQRVRLDETGLGRKLSEDLRRVHGGLIEPINFNLQSKEEMALNMKGLLEREVLWLNQDNKRLLGQIHGIKREISASANIKYSGEPHDDMFWALCLACKGLGKRPFRILTLD
jgi:phage FluMu gp28-like protein